MSTKKAVVSKVGKTKECQLATDNFAELKQLIKYVTVTLIPRIEALEKTVKGIEEESGGREPVKKKPKFILAISGSDDSDSDDGYNY